MKKYQHYIDTRGILTRLNTGYCHGTPNKRERNEKANVTANYIKIYTLKRA